MRTNLKSLALAASIALMTNGCVGPHYSRELVDINSYLIAKPERLWPSPGNAYGSSRTPPSYRRKAKESLHKVLKDKDSFFVTTALLFAASHTSFVEFLRAQSLTDWEIGFCCMYLTGMNGKDLGAFFDNQNSYNISSTIRHKLGLSASN